MEYLNNTIIFLEKENRELKERLRQMTSLVDVINQQRESEEKEFISRMHQEEINVIREIADQNEKSLRLEIKKLNQENNELNSTLEQQLDELMRIKLQLRKERECKEKLEEERNDLKELVAVKDQRLLQMDEEFHAQYERLQNQYKAREQQILERYMQKIDELNDQNEKQIKSKCSQIKLLECKLNNADQQKNFLQEEIERIIKILKNEQKSKAHRFQSYQQEIVFHQNKNQQLKTNLEDMEAQIEIVKLKLQQQQTLKLNLESKLTEMAKKYKHLEAIKQKQIEKQKFKSRSLCQDLSNHKKYIKEQMERQKQKQKELNSCKKILIQKIKQVQHQESRNDISNLSNIHTKSTKKRIETVQSMSLNNSFTKGKENPTVSCFMKDQQLSNRLSQTTKNNLKIQTDNCMFDLLKLKDIETPCFQSTRDKKIKKTIKIRK